METFQEMADVFRQKASGFMSDYVIEQKLDVMLEDWEDGLQDEVIQNFIEWEDYLETLDKSTDSNLYTFDPFSFSEVEMEVVA